MNAIAVAELRVDTPRDLAFAKFIDYSHWDLWMPADFRPASGPARALRMGDTLKVAIGPKGRLVLPLEVVRVRPDKEICWRGGSVAWLRGEHSFLFADDAGKTRIRSEELLDGLLTMGPLGARVERAASDSASVLLARFAEYLSTGRAVPSA